MGHANCPWQIFWQRQSDKQTGPQCKLLVSYLYYCASQIICLLHYICLFISSIIYLNWQLMANLVSPLEIIHILQGRGKGVQWGGCSWVTFCNRAFPDYRIRVSKTVLSKGKDRLRRLRSRMRFSCNCMNRYPVYCGFMYVILNSFHIKRQNWPNR